MSPKELKAMNRYQTRMGEVQDWEVLAANLRSFARRPGRASTITFLPFHQHLARERMTLIEAFVNGIDELNQFGIGRRRIG
jgi:hypothetical protein